VVAGGFEPGSLDTDRPASSAQFHNPGGMAVDGEGNLFLADGANNRVLKVLW